MVDAVEKAGVPNMVWYNYRRVPAVTLIDSMVDGQARQIFHYRAKFLQDWTISPDVPQGGADTWRLDVEAAGSGVTGDLLAHCLDTAIWINGGIAELTAMTETFIKERKHAETGKVQKSESTMPRPSSPASRTARSAPSNPPATPAATRRGYTSRDQRRKRLPNWDLHDLTGCSLRPRVEGAQRGWTNHPGHRRRSSLPRQMVGARPHLWLREPTPSYPPWRTSRLARRRRSAAAPTFRDALETNRVCDAIIASGKSGAWQTL